MRMLPPLSLYVPSHKPRPDAQQSIMMPHIRNHVRQYMAYASKENNVKHRIHKTKEEKHGLELQSMERIKHLFLVMIRKQMILDELLRTYVVLSNNIIYHVVEVDQKCSRQHYEDIIESEELSIPENEIRENGSDYEMSVCSHN
jgi:hypothetical protein